ncbi:MULTISPECIES: non-hydrolyzing UDP-N-acetylglucosamine 2-epimerase [unclassified Novosphingobium]|uniref:non-hydrolyzing UDP-N-acetylglucosamine 2-epimerase n=1 Tax=unclassified Novosphingobium TaxID=2644732 RepID=UPI00086F2F7E|nr:MULTISPECIES: UDP-N-acetylglucosamine 2-epimerase (non-hydrolyzing) [unclassified Novosphingobium]MBN9142971.1 UDP-N-acetylglucosamine 2-epimerase (non-hydrolyzing) [Novosphingobium sp.]MDR6706056.1 UDP-N-acetylglucosamine 2-epimerase (non-hydrolyzing) [Novosphingobium sp. 1748]ODU84884.1 MAG: UDP-N-acetylglucosamine 2-epimerase [Novosphingobium sp. SCN 63-17]OJX89336.1 MAG: UDP-N-acetylglucosamine 2-epimerase [Novosphingobium sp. 63-713]
MTDQPAKILVIFGTRPEAIKLFTVVEALKQDPRFEPVVCVSAQHRAMLDQVLEIAGITPDHDLDLMRPNQTLDGLTAALLTELGEVMDKVKPDRVIVQGDTATAMAGALAAYYRKLPVDHVEAGLRSGNIYHPWPEEVNRKIIGGIASLHFAPTTTSEAALLRENVSADRVHVTGNTVIDALHWVLARIEAQPSLAAGLDDLAERFKGKRIIGVTSHRRENFGHGMENIASAIRQIAERPDTAIIFPVHLNPNVRAVMNERLVGLDNVALIEPLDYPHFARLLSMAEIMLTDSGGVQEEAPALGKPVLVMRETTERPEGVVAGTARLVGTDSSRIVSEIFSLLDDKAAYEAMARAHNPFGDGQSSRRIVDALAQEVWGA